jgi:hypothetical protein
MDRECKGPAMVGINQAVNLTKEQAAQIKTMLMAKTYGHSM